MAKTKTKPQIQTMTISVQQTLVIEREDLEQFLSYSLETVYEGQGLNRGDINWAWGQLADDNDFSCVLEQLTLEQLNGVLPILFPAVEPHEDVNEMIGDFVRHRTLADMTVPDEIMNKVVAYLFPIMDQKVVAWAEGREGRMTKKELEQCVRQDNNHIENMIEHGWAWVDGKLVPPPSFPIPKAPKVGLGVPVAKPVKPPKDKVKAKSKPKKK